MRKEDYRDYATHMFRTYAVWGCRNENDVRKLIGDKYTLGLEPFLSDIRIVDAYLELCIKSGKKHIIDVLKAVYFVQPKRGLRRGDVTARVRRFCTPMTPGRPLGAVPSAPRIFGTASCTMPICLP